jgi:hypothetical protein
VLARAATENAQSEVHVHLRVFRISSRTHFSRDGRTTLPLSSLPEIIRRLDARRTRSLRAVERTTQSVSLKM